MLKYVSLTMKIVTLLILSLFSVTSLMATFRSAPWVPSKRKDLKRIKEALKIKKGDVVYELGCGDGRACSYLAKHTSAKIIIGIELSFLFYVLSYTRSKFKNAGGKVKVMWGDFFKKNYKNADKLFLYLTSKTSNKIAKKLLKEMKEGSRVVSYHFPIPGWEYDKKYQPSSKDIPIFSYTVHKNTQSVIYNI